MEASHNSPRSHADPSAPVGDVLPLTRVGATVPPAGRPANRILQLIPAGEYERLAPHLEEVHLARRQRLYGPNEPISHVYFPETGVLSAISHLADGRSVEVGTIGNEGMLGLPVFLACDSIPLEAIAQVPGVARRMPAPVFRQLLQELPVFQNALHRYTLAFLTQVAQSAACNRAHSITERCARWLLMTHDRMASDRFVLTQDLLAIMLGVNRPGVSQAAASLQEAGLIRYARGRVAITDREGLEKAACECYRIVRQHLDRILPPA